MYLTRLSDVKLKRLVHLWEGQISIEILIISIIFKFIKLQKNSWNQITKLTWIYHGSKVFSRKFSFIFRPRLPNQLFALCNKAEYLEYKAYEYYIR